MQLVEIIPSALVLFILRKVPSRQITNHYQPIITWLAKCLHLKTLFLFLLHQNNFYSFVPLSASLDKKVTLSGFALSEINVKRIVSRTMQNCSFVEVPSKHIHVCLDGLTVEVTFLIRFTIYRVSIWKKLSLLTCASLMLT